MKIEELNGIIYDFSDRRPALKEYNKQPFVISLALLREAGELSEAEQFNRDLGSEVADIYVYLAEFCRLHNLDLVDEVIKKVLLNEKRLPEEQFQEGDFAETYMQLKLKTGERR